MKLVYDSIMILNCWNLALLCSCAISSLAGFWIFVYFYQKLHTFQSVRDDDTKPLTKYLRLGIVSILLFTAGNLIRCVHIIRLQFFGLNEESGESFQYFFWFSLTGLLFPTTIVVLFQLRFIQIFRHTVYEVSNSLSGCFVISTVIKLILIVIILPIGYKKFSTLIFALVFFIMFLDATIYIIKFSKNIFHLTLIGQRQSMFQVKSKVTSPRSLTSPRSQRSGQATTTSTQSAQTSTVTSATNVTSAEPAPTIHMHKPDADTNHETNLNVNHNYNHNRKRSELTVPVTSKSPSPCISVLPSRSPSPSVSRDGSKTFDYGIQNGSSNIKNAQIAIAGSSVSQSTFDRKCTINNINSNSNYNYNYNPNDNYSYNYNYNDNDGNSELSKNNTNIIALKKDKEHEKIKKDIIIVADDHDDEMEIKHKYKFDYNVSFTKQQESLLHTTTTQAVLYLSYTGLLITMMIIWITVFVLGGDIKIYNKNKTIIIWDNHAFLRWIQVLTTTISMWFLLISFSFAQKQYSCTCSKIHEAVIHNCKKIAVKKIIKHRKRKAKLQTILTNVNSKNSKNTKNNGTIVKAYSDSVQSKK